MLTSDISTKTPIKTPMKTPTQTPIILRSKTRIRAVASIFPFISCAALFLVSLLVGGCELDEQPASQNNPRNNPQNDSQFGDSIKISSVPDQESEGAIISLYNGEIKTSDIYADKIWKFSLKDSSVTLGLVVDFYDSTEAITTHLIADSGVILETKRLMVAIGNVVVTNADSSVLLTEELVWNGKTELITSDSFVTFISDGDTIRGTGLRTDKSMRRVKILHQVSGAIGGDGKR